MAALRREHGGSLQFSGIGGERMKAAGLCSLFPMSEINVMGFAELLPALPRLFLRLRQTIAAVRRTSPDLVVGIDSKGFCLRVLGALAADRNGQPPASSRSMIGAGLSVGTPALIQYVAPSAWAFRDAPSRAARLAGVVDELLVLLPFEAKLFSEAGVPSTFVGHPALDDDDEHRTSSSCASHTMMDQGAAALCLLPGSRAHEVTSNLPHMLSAAERIASDTSSGISELLLPVPSAVRTLVESHLRGSCIHSAFQTLREPPRVLVCSDAERFEVYRRSRLAIACSGTVNIELARSRVPQVAVYRSSRVTSFIVRKILRPSIQHATLPNIINSRGCDLHHGTGHGLNDGVHNHDDGLLRKGEYKDGTVRGLIPELLFEDCTASSIADAALWLLANPEQAQAQVSASERALATLIAARDADGVPVPSSRLAARALLRHLPSHEADTAT